MLRAASTDTVKVSLRVESERSRQTKIIAPQLNPGSDRFQRPRLLAKLASQPLQEPEIAARLVHVFGDLLAQGLHRRELDLRPQPLQENQLQLCLGQQFDGMEIQDVTLNRE